MKIKGTINGSLSIYDIDEGEVFTVNNYQGELYMKTDCEDDDGVAIKANAVHLGSGRLFWINEDTPIVLIRGQFVIE